MQKSDAMKIAIHQPNFFPWLGYFHKILNCDRFVFLDDVQNPRTGSGTWTNRVRILLNGEARWFTVPVRREASGMSSIQEIRFFDFQKFKTGFFATLKCNYGKTAHFTEVCSVFEDCFINEPEYLADFNRACVTLIASELGVPQDRFVRSSQLDTGDTAGTGRLIAIVRALGGDCYLSGGGASGYQDDTEFEREGIELQYQGFKHPEYGQGGGVFVPGLSALDALFHVGFEGVLELLRR